MFIGNTFKVHPTIYPKITPKKKPCISIKRYKAYGLHASDN
jgi:hypothetical protein